MTKERAQVEKAADRIRDGLLVTLKELERRREAMMDVRGQLVRHRGLLGWVAGGVVLAVAGGVTLGILQSRAFHRKLPQHRLQGLQRAWEHPERIAASKTARPVPLDLLGKVLFTLLSALAVQVAKRAVLRALPSQPLQRTLTA